MATDEDRCRLLQEEDVFRLTDLCPTERYESDEDESNPYTILVGRRLHVLEAIWKIRARKFESVVKEPEGSPKKVQSEAYKGDSSDFSSKLSLLLIFPLLESQAKTDAALFEKTTDILFNLLKECQHLSLPENSPELDALENLLVSWLTPFTPSVASALVALACARQSLSTLVRTVSILNEEKTYLPVAPIIENLPISGESPSPPVPQKLLESWALKDYHDLDYSYSAQNDEFGLRRMACSSDYLYLISGNEGLIRVGNGRNGTLRGHIYAQNKSLGGGYPAYAGETLLIHSADFSFKIVDSYTLETLGTCELDESLNLEGSDTLQFTSNGTEFFWIRSFPKEESEILVLLDVFYLDKSSKKCAPIRSRVCLTTREESTKKTLKISELIGNKISLKESSQKNKSGFITSCGIDLKTLIQCPILTCGNFISIFTYSSPPQRGIFACKTQGSSTEGVSYCHSFSVHNGEFHSKAEFTDAFNEHRRCYAEALSKGSTAVYDTFNNLIWIISTRGVCGLRSANVQSHTYLKTLLGIPQRDTKTVSNDKDLCLLDDVRKNLLRHAGLLCSIPGEQRLRPSLEGALESILQRVKYRKDTEGTLCILKIISKVHISDNNKTLINSVRNIVTADVEQSDASVLASACDVIIAKLKDDRERLNELFSSFQGKQNEFLMKGKLLSYFSASNTVNAEMILYILSNESFIDKLLEESIDETNETITSFLDTPETLFKDFDYPKLTPRLQFLKMIMTRYYHFVLIEKEKFSVEDFTKVNFKLLKLLRNKCFPILTKSLRNFKRRGNLKDLQGKFEKVIKSSILGTLLQTSITVLYHPKFLGLRIIKEEVKEMISFLKDVGKAASEHYRALRETSDTEKEQGFLTDTPLLSSWPPPRIVESPHPIKSGYKHEENIIVPNSSKIFLKFDHRCEIHPDDKLTLLRWNKVFAEFSGASWPREEYEIEWPTSILISLECKGPEDQRYWGFKIYISEHESQLKSMNFEFPHLAELYLGISALIHSYIELLYWGPEITPEEKQCKSLLELKLFQRCVWNKEYKELPRIKLPQKFVSKMRSVTEVKLPPLRPSVKKILRVEELEEGILASVLKHLGFMEVAENLSRHEEEQTTEYKNFIEIVEQTHHRINALIRRLHILADLENQWQLEVDCLKDDSVEFDDIFFKDYHLHEGRWKELVLLCFLKGVDVNTHQREKAVKDLILLIEKEIVLQMEEEISLSKTKKVVDGIAQKIELLLRVSIDIERSENSDMMTRSLTSWPDPIERKKRFIELERSWDDSILQIPNYKRTFRKPYDDENQTLETEILDEIFAFIGSHPEKAVSHESFLDAISIRQQRCESRNFSLTMMNDLLNNAREYGVGTKAASSLILIVKFGLEVEELMYGAQSIDQIRKSFTEFASMVTQISKVNPAACKNCIEVLCEIPYQKDDEECLIQSGLVGLLNKLCSSSEHSDLAWRGFKSLAKCCVSWEKEKEEDLVDRRSKKIFCSEDLGNSLARQLSSVLTSHLIRITSSFDEKRNEALEEIISLLVFMSKCQTGKDMLSQPACVSELLELLLEPMSPKMILEIVQLCHVALPQISEENIRRVNIPKWVLGFSQDEESENEDSEFSRIIQLIMAKLADYLVPGCQVSSKLYLKRNKAAQKVSTNTNIEQLCDEFSPEMEVSTIPATMSSMDHSTMSLFIHKRENQSANEMIQLLLNINTEVKLFPMNGNVSNMEKVVKIDNELCRRNKAEILTDDATAVFRKGMKLSKHGFVVSVSTAARSDEAQDTQTCRERNIYLSRTDPIRPFISSLVANSLAEELISLVHTLTKFSMWIKDINGVLKSNLKKLESLIKSTDSLYDVEDPVQLFKLYSTGRQTSATLAIIGAFEQRLKPSNNAIIIATGEVIEISNIDEERGTALIDNIGEISLGQLEIHRRLDNEAKTLYSILIIDDIVNSCHTLLLPDMEVGIDPLSAALPANGDGWSLKLAVSRIMSEIRTKMCKLLDLYTREDGHFFITSFMKKSYQAVDMLKLLAKDVLPIDDEDATRIKCENLKSIYRDCVKPPAPAHCKSLKSHKTAVSWNPSTNFPPVKHVFFSYSLTGMTYYGETSNSSSIPRGVFVYGTISMNGNSFRYFEIDILSLGESLETSETSSLNATPILSIGLAPICERRIEEGGTWSNPNGTVLFHNNGRVVHYSGNSLLEWKSLKFEKSFNPGDIIGICWEKSLNREDMGMVKFTYNGILLDQAFDDVKADLYPAIHIQKKGVRIRTNFGNGGQFKYEEATVPLHTNKVEQKPELKVETAINEMSSFLQFNIKPSKDSLGAAGHRRLSTITSRIALKSKEKFKYDINESLKFHHPLSGNPILTSGPYNPRFATPLDDDTDDENSDDECEQRFIHEDLNSLVVKAWENKIFPIIRRRFRNDSERKDGLEQIKGALALGMTDIARQTVEFLYEENGGIPQDLHLPTVEDIKIELSKLSIERVKKGMLVEIGTINEELGFKIGSASIFETEGLTGEILEVDTANELLQVETYLKLNGVLVRYWYPLSVLEKPTGHRGSSKMSLTSMGIYNIHNPDIHRELLNTEYALSRLYCRSAYLNLMRYSTENLNYDDLGYEEFMISSIMMFQDTDLDNLRLLSDSFLRKAEINGQILSTNITLQDSKEILNLYLGNFSDLFYKNTAKLKEEITRILIKEENIIDFTDQLGDCIVNPSEHFMTEEITVNDLSILKAVITFKNSAFVAISCKSEDDLTSLGDLVIQIQTLKGGRLKSNGRNTSRDEVQYPSTPSEQGDETFPSVLIADDTIQVSHGGGGEFKCPQLILFGIHRDFPLVIAFIETLLNSDLLPQTLLEKLTHKLATFILNCPLPLFIKERTFSMLTCSLKRFSFDTCGTQLDDLFFPIICQELKRLYEIESQNKTFSTYFQSLFELALTRTKSLKELECCSWFSELQKIINDALRLGDDNSLEETTIVPNDTERILVLQNIPRHLTTEDIRSEILKIVDPLGGIYEKTELFVPKFNDSVSSEIKPKNDGYAVIQVRFMSKLNLIKDKLDNCLLFCEPGDFISEENPDFGVGLIVSKVDALFSTQNGNEYALTAYLRSKFFKEDGSLCESFSKIISGMSKEEIKNISKLQEKTIKDSEELRKAINTCDIRRICLGIKECKYDLLLRSTANDVKKPPSTLEEHAQLVMQINEYCKDYSLCPFDIHPNEVHDSRYQLSCLQKMNKSIQRTNLLSIMHNHKYEQDEIMIVLKKIIFNTVKLDFFTGKLASKRNETLAPPEVILNPVEDIGTMNEAASQTWFCQAMSQLAETNSKQFCVRYATGGDPELPFNVKMVGEEVLGNSGSFRHFLSRVTQELQSRALPLFIPNSESEKKGFWTLKNDDGDGIQTSFQTKKYLQFFGQLLGMSLRAGIPLALNIMPQNWKALSGVELDENDLKDFDSMAYKFLCQVREIKEREEFEQFIEDNHFPKMVSSDVSGTEKELIKDGNSIYLSWYNREEFIEALWEFKNKEMRCEERWEDVKAGLATIIPLTDFISLFSCSEIETFICGQNTVNVHYIREHTIYQVGIKESDSHVQHFWSVLKSLSQSELKKFVKFASNQDRIQTWSEENLPPYPMKIAPADLSPEECDPDQRYIRVETCMFMIKLPRYSSFEIMKEKILFAISSALDPLSG